MPVQVVDLPALIPTSCGSPNTQGVGLLDDAASITLFISSSAATASTGAGAPLTLQVSQLDPSIGAPGGVTQSSQFVNYIFTSTTGGTPVLTTGTALTLTNISYRGIRLTNLTSAVLNEVIARLSKQVSV